MATPKERLISVLYIRQSAGSGGGADSVIFDSLKYINKETIKISLIYLRRKGFPYQDFRLKTMNINVFNLEGWRIFDPIQFYKIIQIIRRNHVDIIHTHDPKSNFYGIMLRCIFSKIKLISTLHGWTNKTQKSRLYSNLDKRLLRRFDAVVAVSGKNAEIAKEHKISSPYLIRNAIDIQGWSEPNTNAFQSNRLHLGWVGRLSPEKGPQTFIEVAKRICELYPDVQFSVAGEGSELDRMVQKSKVLGLYQKIKFLGYRDHLQLKQLYQNLDVLLMTSRTEGMPITILEAGLMRVPVIAMNVGGVGELIENNKEGLLISSGDIDGMVSAVFSLRKNPEQTRKITENLYEKVNRHYSIQTRIKELEYLYSDLIKS